MGTRARETAILRVQRLQTRWRVSASGLRPRCASAHDPGPRTRRPHRRKGLQPSRPLHARRRPGAARVAEAGLRQKHAPAHVAEARALAGRERPHLPPPPPPLTHAGCKAAPDGLQPEAERAGARERQGGVQKRGQEGTTRRTPCLGPPVAVMRAVRGAGAAGCAVQRASPQACGAYGSRALTGADVFWRVLAGAGQNTDPARSRHGPPCTRGLTWLRAAASGCGSPPSSCARAAHNGPAQSVTVTRITCRSR
jgi:hypothetical protein